MARVIKIAIIGAESTGKTSLAKDLAQKYAQSYPSAHVPEFLRLFVDEERRTPLEQEQIRIAKAQKNLEEEIALRLQSNHQLAKNILLFCDTTPLLTAIYSEIVFGKVSEDLLAIAANHDYDLTFFTQVDFPWISDGIQRDGPKAQARVHNLLDTQLKLLNISHQKLYGKHLERLETANRSLEILLKSSKSKNSL
jgi:nicotinamide riboside kinase